MNIANIAVAPIESVSLLRDVALSFRLMSLSPIHFSCSVPMGRPANPHKTSTITFLQGGGLRLFRRSTRLAFYGHLKRLIQYIVVANCAVPYEQVTPRSIFNGSLAQRRRIQHHLNCVAYLDRNVITRGVRDATSGSFMNFNFSDDTHLIL